jgi:haloalkane dehalogenase
VPAVELKREGEIPYREALPDGEPSGDPVLLAHGFPESSLMWEPVMRRLAEAGRRSLAADLYCLGDSADPGPATFERNREALAQFHQALGLGRVALVVHDWGGFVGLAWACEHPDAVSALVISDTGFFSDGRWHGMAKAMRSDQGEELIAALDRDGFAALLQSSADFSEEAIDAYWRPFAEGRGREATLEFYRSMDFEKLAPYEGKLGELGVPTLLLWGERDQFAPMGGARRFEREIPGAELLALDADHFVYDELPERCADEVAGFLGRAAD